MKKIYLSLLVLTVLLIASNAEAQIKIGTNGATIAPSSLLELESANQGLLLPRMADTVAINALAPPNGMLIYLTKAPAVGLYVRKVTGWEYLTGSLGGAGNFSSLTVSGSVTAGSFSGPLTGNASTATLATTATNSNNASVTNDISNPAITYPVFVNSTPGYQPLRTSSGNLSYVPATGILTARGFAGPLTGNVTGNATSAIDAQNTVNLRITDDVISPTPMYPTFVNGTTGPIPARVSSTKLSFIPSSGELTATTFRGALLGNATSATSVTGVVNAVNGGTGFAVYTPGDMLYADASNTLAKLPVGLPGTILRVDPNRVPQWSTAGAGTVINVSGTSNRIVVTDPTVSPQIDIDANYVGQPSITTLGTISTGTWNGSTLSSSYGGTGVTSLTANEVLIGRGPGNSIGSISLVNTLGKVLTSNGPNALPTFEAPGVGDMILNAVQTVTGGKTFADGTLNLSGAVSGTAILKANPTIGGTVTLPGGNRTLVSLDGVETLSNKTIVAANLTGTTNFNTLDGASLIVGGGAPLTTTNQTGTAGSIVMSNAPTIAGPTFTGVVTNSGTINSVGNITAPLFNGPAYTAQRIGTGGTERDAVAIANAVDRATDATDANTASRIVSRNASGDFSAGTITATLNGNATNVSGVVAIANGGTGASTKATAFNALSPMTSQGDLIYGGVAGTGTRLPIGSATQVLKGGATAPVWGSVVLTTDVSNVLPPANGGTGVANTNTITLTGANIALTATGATAITLPTTGTLATLAGTEALTNKTVNGTAFTGAGGGTLSLANGNTFTTVGANPITITSAAGGSAVTLPQTGVLYSDRANSITSASLAGALVDESGTGVAVFSASPALTGTPTAPTALPGTNTTQIATTAFVLANSGILKFSNVNEAAAPSIAVGDEAEVDYPAVGALTTGTATVSPVAILDAGLGIMSARISAAGVVTVRYRNFSAGPITPSVNLNISVIQ